MKLKPGWIYIIKTNWGEAMEGEFHACVKTVNVFSPLPFFASECPSLINDEDIDWVEPVCSMSPNLTRSGYYDALSKLNHEE